MDKFDEAVDEAVIQEGKFKSLATATMLGLGAMGTPDVQAEPNQNPPIVNVAQMSDTDLLATTLYKECRGESKKGQEMVLSVIINRMKRKNESVRDVVLKKKQFSCWNASHDIDRGFMIDDPQFREFRHMSAKALAGRFEPLGDWDHYYAHNTCSPDWADSLENVTVEGEHTFGKGYN